MVEPAAPSAWWPQRFKVALRLYGRLERWLSGRKRTTRNRLTGNRPWVRIPPSPFLVCAAGTWQVSECFYSKVSGARRCPERSSGNPSEALDLLVDMLVDIVVVLVDKMCVGGFR